MAKSRRIISIILLIIFASTSVTWAAGFDEHEIKFSKILNARDMGGYRTKDGRIVKKNILIRSGELSYATKGDLAKLKDQYRLHKVIDFRHATDFKYCKDKRIAGVKYRNLPAKYKKRPSKAAAKRRYKKLRNKSSKKLKKAAIPTFGKAGRSYTRDLVLSAHSQRMYRKYFEELLDNPSEKGVLIHCIYGKDRTGVAAFMTLVALGVDEETAYKEYAMTNSYLQKHGKKTYNKGRIGVREKDLRYAVNKAKKKYGSLERFMRIAYGLDEKKLTKLRDIYTE